MSKVFIINDGGHDYSQAQTFGKLIVMTQGSINRFHLTKMVRTFSEFLGSSSEDDYLLFGGPALMAAVACSVFATKHKRLNLLIWMPDDETGGTYICRKTILQGGET